MTCCSALAKGELLLLGRALNSEAVRQHLEHCVATNGTLAGCVKDHRKLRLQVNGQGVPTCGDGVYHESITVPAGCVKTATTSVFCFLRIQGKWRCAPSADWPIPAIWSGSHACTIRTGETVTIATCSHP
eukprot:4697853-Amphidinium_carterae.1